jgi:hypothetical protein
VKNASPSNAKTHIKLASRFFMVVFFILAVGLLAFCLLFGLPFFAQFPAGIVLESAGCRPSTFDTPAICPAGSYAEPFIPLGSWLGSFLAPIILIGNFGVILASWLAICVFVGLLWWWAESASVS